MPTYEEYLRHLNNIDYSSDIYSSNLAPTERSEGLLQDIATPTTPVTGDWGESKYDEGIPVSDINNLDAVRGERQPMSAKLGAGAVRLVGTTGTKFMEGLGFVGGLTSGSMDFALNNGWVRLFENAEEEIKKAAPVYKSAQYLNGNVFDQMGTTEFWMDDVVDGLAFMASSLIGSKGLSMAGKAAGAERLLGKGMSKFLNSSAKTGVVADNAIKVKPIIDEMGLLGMSTFNSFNEAGFEARDNQEQIRKEQAVELFNKPYEYLDPFQKQQVDFMAAEGAKKTYLGNVVALMPSNYVTNAFFFKPFKASKSRISSIMNSEGTLVESVKPLTIGDRVGAVAKNIGKSIVSEGIWEENIQTAIQNYNKKTAGQDISFLESIPWYSEEWLNNFTTDEGQKSIVLGSIIGTLGGTVGAVREQSAEKAGEVSLHKLLKQNLANFHLTMTDMAKIDPKTGNIVPGEYDSKKLEQELLSQWSAKIKNISKISALASNDPISYDVLNSTDFAVTAFDFLGDENGLDHLNNQIDVWAEREIEQNTAENTEVDQKAIDALSVKYKEEAKKLQQVYDHVTNNVTAFFSETDLLEELKPSLSDGEYKILENNVKGLQSSWTKSLYIEGAQQKILSRIKTDTQTRLNKEFADVKQIAMQTKEYKDLLDKRQDALTKLAEAKSIKESEKINKEITALSDKISNFSLEGVEGFKEYNFLEKQLARIEKSLQKSVNNFKTLSSEKEFAKYAKDQIKSQLEETVKENEETARKKAEEDRKTAKEKINDVVDKVKETATKATEKVKDLINPKQEEASTETKPEPKQDKTWEQKISEVTTIDELDKVQDAVDMDESVKEHVTLTEAIIAKRAELNLKHTQDVIDDNYEDGKNPLTPAETDVTEEAEHTSVMLGAKRINVLAVINKTMDKNSDEVTDENFLYTSLPEIVGVGTKVFLSFDTTYVGDSVSYNAAGKPVVKKTTYGEIKSSTPLDVPIKIEIEVEGKRVKIGYLPTIEWTSAMKNGRSLHIANEQEGLEGNLEAQIKIITDLRKELTSQPTLNATYTINQKGIGRLIKSADKSETTVGNALPNILNLDIWGQDTQPFTIYNKGFRVQGDRLFDGDLAISDEYESRLQEGNMTGTVFVMIPTSNGKFIPTPATIGKITPGMVDAIMAAIDLRTQFSQLEDEATKEAKARAQELNSKTGGRDIMTTSGLRDFISEYVFMPSLDFKPSAGRPTIRIDADKSNIIVDYNNKSVTISLNNKDPKSKFNINYPGNKELLQEVLHRSNFSVKLSRINTGDPINILTYDKAKGEFQDSTQPYNEHVKNLVNTNLREKTAPNGKPVYTIHSVMAIDKSTEVKQEETETIAEPIVEAPKVETPKVEGTKKARIAKPKVAGLSNHLGTQVETKPDTTDALMTPEEQEEFKDKSAGLLVRDGEYMYDSEKQDEILGIIRFLIQNAYMETSKKGDIFYVRKAFDNAKRELQAYKSNLEYLAQFDTQEELNEEFEASPEYAQYSKSSLSVLKSQLSELERVLKPEVWEQFTAFSKIDLQKVGFKEVNDKLTEAAPKDSNGDEITEENGVEMGENEGGYERKGFMDGASFQLNSKNTASSRIKLWLSTLMAEESTVLGIQKAIPLDTAWDDLLEALSPVDINLYDFLGTIRNIYTENPAKMYLKQVFDKLTSQDTDFRVKNEFVSVFGKNHQSFEMVLYTRNADGSISGKVANSDRNTVQSRILGQWNENFKNSDGTTLNAKGELVVNKEGALVFKERMLKFNSKTPKEDLITFVKDLFAFTGIMMSDVAFDDTMKLLDTLNHTAFKARNKQVQSRYSVSGSFLQQFQFVKQGNPNGIFSIIVDSLTREVPKKVVDGVEVEADSVFALNNPFVGEQQEKVLKLLAAQEAKFSSVMFSKTFKNVEGKTIYAYGMHNFETLETREFINNEKLRSLLKLDSYSSRSLWLDPDYTPKLLEVLAIEYVDGMRQQARGKEGITKSDMSKRELMLDTLSRFFNNGNDEMFIVDLTKSDKSTSLMIKAPRIRFSDGKLGIDSTKFVDGKVTAESISARLLARFMNVVKGEADRMLKVNSILDSKIKEFEDKEKAVKWMKDNYGKYYEGSQYFFHFPALNNVVRKNGVMNYDLLQGEGLLTLEAVVAEEVAKMINTSIDYMKESGLATEVEQTPQEIAEGKPIKYTTPFNQKYVDKYGQGLQGEALLAFVAADYNVNYFLTTTSMMQTILGDPAMAWKGTVEKTLAEYQKREAKDIAPGMLSNTKWEFTDRRGFTWKGKRFYNTVFAKDDVSSNTVDGYAKELGYDNVAGTDAQELVTLEQYLNDLMNYGRIPEEIFASIITKIYKAKVKGDYDYNLEQNELYALKKASVVFQAQKPVQVYSSFGPDGIRTVKYIKTSAFPLIPNITKGVGLDALRIAMERGTNAKGVKGKSVDRLVFMTGVKIGGVNEVEIADADGNIHQDLQFKAEHMNQMDKNRFLIQQDVPYEATKREIVTISQMNKLLFEGILDYEGFDFLGKKGYTAAQLKNLKDELRKQLFRLAKDSLFKRLGIEDIEGVPTITKKSLPLIQKALVEEAIGRGWDINSIKSLQINEEGNFVIPLAFNNSANKIESMLLSLFNPIVKQKMSGKSFIQGSSIGFKAPKIETWNPSRLAKESGIVYTKGFDPKTGLKFLNTTEGENPEVISYCEVLIPFKFLNNKGELLDVQEYVIKEGPNKGMLDIDKVDPELLNLIGARIPNQGHSSQVAIKVVGFLPAVMGDLIIVPSQITKQMGSDFDVDKLYSYMFNTIVNEKGELKKIPSAIDTETGEINYKELDKWIREQFAGKIALRKEIEKAAKGIIKGSLEEAAAEFAEGQGEEVAEPTKAEEKAAIKKILEDRGLTMEDIQTMYSKALTKKVLQNAYIDIHWSILSNAKVMQKCLEPLDKKDLETTGDNIVNDQLFNSPGRQMDDFISQRAGKDGVSVYSRAVVGATVIQDKALHLCKIVKTDDGLIKERIFFKGFREGENPIMLTDLSGVGISKFEGEQRTKIQNLILQQSAAVDNAKDPKLDKNNFNMTTFNASIIISLLQTEKGKALDLRYNAFFLRQEIVRDFVSEMQTLSDGLNNVFTKDKNKYVIKLLKEKYLSRLATVNEKGEPVAPKYDTTNKSFSLNDMEEMLKNKGSNGADYVRDQLEILAHFSYLDEVGRELSEVFGAVSTDSKGFGKNLQEIAKKRIQIDGLSNKQLIANAEQALYGEAGDVAMYVALVDDTLNQLFPYNEAAVQEVTGELENLRNLKDINTEFRQEIFEELKSFMFTQQSLGWDWTLEELLTETDKGPSLKTLVEALKKTDFGRKNFFVRNLFVDSAVKEGQPSTVKYVASQVERTDDINVIRGFVDMLTSKDPKISELGEKLVAYAYLTGGLQEAVQFVKYVPSDYLVVKKIGQNLRTFDNVNTYKFVKQFLQHNPSYAPKSDTEAKKGILIIDGEKESDLLRKERNAYGKIVIKLAKFVTVRDRKNNRWTLFEKVSEDGITATYTQIPLLGSANLKLTGVKEYNANGTAVSLYDDNATVLKPKKALNGMDIGFDDAVANAFHEGKVAVKNYIPTRGYKGIMALNEMRKAFTDPAYKAVLDFLSAQGDYLSMEFTAEIDNDLKDAGQFDWEENSLRINPTVIKNSTKFLHNREVIASDIERVLVHELIHAYTSKLINLSETDPNNSKLTPQIKQAIAKLKYIHNFAIESLNADDKRDLKALKEELIKAKEEKRKAKVPENASRLYGYTKVSEFIAEAMSTPEFQKELNAMDFNEEQSVFARLKQVVAELLLKLGEFLGVEVRDKSVLKATITSTIDLISRGDLSTDRPSNFKEVSMIEAEYNRPDPGDISWMFDPNNKIADLSVVAEQQDLGMTVGEYMRTLDKGQRELLRQMMESKEIKFKCK